MLSIVYSIIGVMPTGPEHRRKRRRHKTVQNSADSPYPTGPGRRSDRSGLGQ